MSDVIANARTDTSRKKRPLEVLILATREVIGEHETEQQAIDFVYAWNERQPSPETLATYRRQPRVAKPKPASRRLKPVKEQLSVIVALTGEVLGTADNRIRANDIAKEWNALHADPARHAMVVETMKKTFVPVPPPPKTIDDVRDDEGEDMKELFDPDISPEEMEFRKREVQSEWTQSERRRRQVWKPYRRPEVPVGRNQLKAWGLM